MLETAVQALCKSPFLKRWVSHTGLRSPSYLGSKSWAAFQEKTSQGFPTPGLEAVEGGCGCRAGSCPACSPPISFSYPRTVKPGISLTLQAAFSLLSPLNFCTLCQAIKWTAETSQLIKNKNCILVWWGFWFFLLILPLPVLLFWLCFWHAFIHKTRQQGFLKQQSYPETLKPAGQGGISANSLAAAALLYMKKKKSNICNSFAAC